MRTVLLAVVALVLGTALGVASTRLELPNRPSPAVRYLNAAETAEGGRPGSIGPRANVVNGELYDFGRMDRKSKLSHAFIIKNDGDAPLVLEKGETTCKCTVSDLKNNELPPGETTEVLLEWTANTDAPEFSQSAELHTNDPARPKIRLLVQGKVRDAVRPDRSELSFNNLPANEEATVKMKIFGFHDEPLEVTGHEWLTPDTAELFDASFRPLQPDELDKSLEATSGVEMTVKLKSGLPLGPIAQTIRLATNYDVPALEIPIVGRIVGDITIIGPGYTSNRNSLQMGLIDRDKGKQVTLRAVIKGNHRDDVQLTIESVEPSDSLSAKLGEPVREAQLVIVPIVLEVPPGATPGSHLGTAESKAGRLVLKTTHPQIPEIDIEVRFAVNP